MFSIQIVEVLQAFIYYHVLEYTHIQRIKLKIYNLLIQIAKHTTT